MIYRIAGWADRFENNRTREMKSMAWLPLPNQLDGDGYTELLDHDNGAAHYAAWVCLLAIASRCDPRGTLLRDCRTLPRDAAVTPQEGAEHELGQRRPHDARSLSRMSRIPVEVYEEAIPRLIAIGWLEVDASPRQDVTPIPREGAGLAQEGAGLAHPAAKKGTERNGREQNGKKEASLPFDGDKGVVDADCERKRITSKAELIYLAYPKRVGKKDALPAIEAAIKAIGFDELLEATKAFAASPKGRGKFVKDPVRWYRGGCYADDRSVWESVDDAPQPPGCRTLPVDRNRPTNGRVYQDFIERAGT